MKVKVRFLDGELYTAWMKLSPTKSAPCEHDSDAVRYLLFWSLSSDVDIARVLYLLEHAHNVVAVLTGGATADRMRGRAERAE